VPDYQGVLAEVAAFVQRAALYQAVPDMALDEAEDADSLQRIAKAFSAEDLQLNYQIALVGRRDLELAPDARSGFEMVLLRMLAFQPAREGATEIAAGTANSRPIAPVTASVATAAPQPKLNANAEVGDEWARIVAQLNLQGPASQLAAHCSLLAKEGDRVRVLLDDSGEPFRRPALEDKLSQALSTHFGTRIVLDIARTPDVPASLDTPARRQQAQAQDRLQAARVAIESDPNVRAMRDVFGATVQPDSIKPN